MNSLTGMVLKGLCVDISRSRLRIRGRAEVHVCVRLITIVRLRLMSRTCFFAFFMIGANRWLTDVSI